MATFCQRHCGYVCGCGLLLLGMLLFTTGFATPLWWEMNHEPGQSGTDAIRFHLEAHFGLWRSCVKYGSVDRNCAKLPRRNGTLASVQMLQGESLALSVVSLVYTHIYLRARILGPVQVLQCASLALSVVSLVYACRINFCEENPSASRLLEICIGLAGVLGLSGALTFAAAVKDAGDHFSHLFEGLLDLSLQLSWSFGLDVAGSVLLLLSAVFIAVFNRPLDTQLPNFTFVPLNKAGQIA